MKATLKVSHTKYYQRLLLLFLLVICCSIGLYFLIYSQLSSLIIGIGLSSLLIPWSFFYAISELDKTKKQFQKITFLEDYMIFEHLPMQGGEKVQVKINFENIKSVKLTKNEFQILLVPRYEWVGVECSFITPSGYVPRKQVFSWCFISRLKKKIILDCLKARNIWIEDSTDRFNSDT